MFLIFLQRPSMHPGYQLPVRQRHLCSKSYITERKATARLKGTGAKFIIAARGMLSNCKDFRSSADNSRKVFRNVSKRGSVVYLKRCQKNVALGQASKRKASRNRPGPHTTLDYMDSSQTKQDSSSKNAASRNMRSAASQPFFFACGDDA